MVLRLIALRNFRNYAQKEIFFSDDRNLIVGPNAAGKSNILEGIYLLATGKSFRVKGVESEMIRYGEEVADVEGLLGSGENLKIILTRGIVMGEKVAKKKYLVNGVGKRAIDFIGHLRAVYFGPEDLELVLGSPSIRRKYLDNVLTQVDKEYARASLSYEKGLKTRNRILEEIREARARAEVGGLLKYNEETERKKLYFWDQLLIKNGNLITAKREEFINFLNANSTLLICKMDSATVPCFQIEYGRSPISLERLAQYEKEEVAAASTLVGPHRDDFKVRMLKNGEKLAEEVGVGRDLAVYGSRGEQRLAVLWLKLGELKFIREKTQEPLVLLLDDIFSELDVSHRKMVLDVVGEQQTIITTADLGMVEKEWLSGVKLIKLP
jgi:DNA replication and repair protein RecF